MECKKCEAYMPDTYKVCMRCGTPLTQDFEDSVITSEEIDNNIEYSKKSRKLLRISILSIFTILSIFFIYKIYPIIITKIDFSNLQELLATILISLLILIMGAEIYQEKTVGFKKGFFKFLIIFFVIIVIVQLVSGNISQLADVTYLSLLIIICFIGYVVYFGFKKIIWFILEKILSAGYLPFYIIYLGLILPVIYLLVEHFL